MIGRIPPRAARERARQVFDAAPPAAYRAPGRYRCRRCGRDGAPVIVVACLLARDPETGQLVPVFAGGQPRVLAECQYCYGRPDAPGHRQPVLLPHEQGARTP